MCDNVLEKVNNLNVLECSLISSHVNSSAVVSLAARQRVGGWGVHPAGRRRRALAQGGAEDAHHPRRQPARRLVGAVRPVHGRPRADPRL